MSDITLCSLVMDRGEVVKDVLENWNKTNYFKNIIIVDWYSRVPLYNHLEKYINKYRAKNIFVVRALNQEIFYITKARNLCMKFMKDELKEVTSHTLIIDSDVRLSEKRINLDELGSNTILWDNSQCCLWGTVLMPTKAFWDVNGYYEKITYMHSDIDFINRLKLKGYNIKDDGLKGNLEHIFHFPAQPNKRLIKNNKQIDISDSTEWQNNGIMESIDVEIYYYDGTTRKAKL